MNKEIFIAIYLEVSVIFLMNILCNWNFYFLPKVL